MKSLLSLSLLASVLLVPGCSKDDDGDPISLKETEKTLYHDNEYQIEAESKSGITYSSEDEYHANVSASGLVTAMFVGETNIVLKNNEEQKKVKIIVKPVSNLYPEPDVDFGATKSQIKAKFGTPVYETSTAMLIEDYSNAAPDLMFLFDESGKMISYAVMVKSIYSEILAEFLTERYKVVDEEEGVYLLINGLDLNTATMAICLQLYDISYWMVVYLPNEDDKKSTVKNNGLNDIMSEFDKLLNQVH